ncbi:type II secretion system F family protein [Nocardioides sp. LHG3406-4]|uniref:type II secretion system F family protein n=1 Tax=Nocardioides sp. LHG3406-4 TaxID=2804575 RepID=UPI003CFB3ED3
MLTALAVLLAGGACALGQRWERPVPRAAPAKPLVGAPPRRSGRLLRVVWSLCAGLGAWTFLGGPTGLVAGLAAAVVAWVVLARAEPAVVRRRRELARRQLPHLVGLLVGPLRAGAATEEAMAIVCAALPGPAADRFDDVRRRLRWGTDPVVVWEELATDPELGLLGRTLARAHESGASVSEAIEGLADELAEAGRADAEDRARQVGVRAAVPLGLCLLPAFLLLGIVPLVAGLLASIGAPGG